MNLILALLKKEFISFKNKYMIFFMFVVLFPLILFLFFSIPLSMVFVSIKPIYMIWSSSGLYVVTTMITSFLISVILLIEKMKKEFFFAAPIPISSFIISTYIFVLIIALVQFFVSVMLISFLSDNFLSIFDFLLIFIILIPSIFVICSLSLITACFVEKSVNIVFIGLFLFILFSFGLGSFFPIDYYPEFYVDIFKYLPISSSIMNVHKIVAAESIYFSFLIVSIIYMIFFSMLAVIITHNKVKERLF